MSIVFAEGSAFDSQGYYTGPETLGIPTKFGPYCDCMTVVALNLIYQAGNLFYQSSAQGR